MKIRNFILIGTLTIIAITVLIVVISGIYFVNGEIKYQVLASANDQLGKFNVAMAEISKAMSSYVLSDVLYIYYGANIQNTLSKMKDSSGAEWTFITIGGTNYIYPYQPNAVFLDAKTRPWYILATSHPQDVVMNDFYSPTLNASVVTFSAAFDKNGVKYVGGLIFTEKQFFDMLTSKSGSPFLIMQNGVVIYPSNVNVTNNSVIVNGINYRVQTFNYGSVMSSYDMFSSMPYTLGILIPSSSIFSNLSWTVFYLVLITFAVGIGEIILMILVSRRIAKSVELLQTVSSHFDPHKGEIEVEEKVKDEIYRFKETKDVFDKMHQLFQEIIAQIQELKATNEELESSYEEIEQLSNNLSKESQELKELFEVSNFVSLSTGASSKRILLDRLMKIYGCAGVALVDLIKNENNTIETIGEKFELVDLSKIGKELADGKIVEVNQKLYGIIVVPVMFESRMLALIEMAFRERIPEIEKESLSRFMIGFAASLNSQRLVSEIKNAYIYLSTRLAEISEVYDYETGSHIHRVGEYCAFMASKLAMKEDFILDIRTYAMIHDIGKLKVPREILMKNGPLTREEFEEMKKHTIYGEQLLGEAPFLEMARHIARHHHEKYDGSGYPDGLRGEEIPIESRIMAIADVYDALRSPRRYKPSFTHEEAVKVILEGDGRTKPDHFDPRILEIFRKYNLEFKRIYESLLDEEEKNG